MRVVVFSPHAGIWVHAFPEALIADALRGAGMDVTYVTCDGALSTFCIAMGAQGLSPSSSHDERLAVCKQCKANRDLLRDDFALRGYDFDSVLEAEDRMAIERAVARASPREVAAFEVGGVAVGRATLYEYLIQNKRAELTVPDVDWPRFRMRLTNTVRSLYAANKILDREQPDRVLAYNTLYSVNAMWRAAVSKRGIRTYFLHAGSNLSRRLQTMMIGRDSTFGWFAHAVEAWRSRRELPCGGPDLALVTDHYEQLFQGASVFAYSAAKAARTQDIRGRFGVRQDQRLLVATMSSYDEYAAAAAIGEIAAESTLLFPRQRDWIRALVQYVAQRRDLFLVVRVHPREFPNKRDAVKSDHALELERELVNLPANVKVNWPTDELSIYDLADQTDVFLNAWSSAGREMSLLGIPVVVYAPELLLYPPDLNYVGTTEPTYFAAIERALADGWSFERVRRAYRWSVLELVHGVADLADGFDFRETPPATPIERAWRFALSLPRVRQRYDLLRRPPRLRAAAAIAEAIRTDAPLFLSPSPVATLEEETAALRREIGRLARALSGEDPRPASPTSLRAKLSAISAEND